LLILKRLYTSGILYIVCVLGKLTAPGLDFHFNPGAAYPEDEKVMLETCKGPYFLIN
jgi:hypothetical protein